MTVMCVVSVTTPHARTRPLLTACSFGLPAHLCSVPQALRKESAASAASEGRKLRFLANVDPVDVSRACEGLDPETTLVIVISKTFTTAETMLNARSLRSWLVKSLTSTGKLSEAEIVAKHIAVSLTVLHDG